MISSVTSAYSTQAVGSVQNSQQQAQAQPREQAGDKVSLSEPSKLVSTYFTDLGIEYTPGQPITLSDLKGGLERSTAKLQDDVNALFLENGISLSPPVELTTDGEGSVRVKGDHPEKAKIEQLFADNPELSNDFRGVSGLSALVESGEEYIKFAAEYDKDPYAAVAKYSHFFDALKKDEFSMMFGATEEQEAS